MEVRDSVNRGAWWLGAGAAVLLAVGSCVRTAPVPPPPPPPAPPVSRVEVPLVPPPPVEREFRGVWVASVSNLDWPSRRGLPAEQQRAELVTILDRAVQLGLNAVILQVRPAGDALYPSELEPWSEYLTGQMGRAPEPFYDPLAFAVEEAHRRGLELHAWFNPYRARHPSARSAAAPSHVSRARPELVRTYGSHLWMDPGEAAVQDHTVRVILDVVRRYDIDGVHIDDYFYPYRENGRDGKPLPFPDAASYARYQRAGGTLARDDWRRDNVDRLVERLYGEIKAAKPWVKFGISPFGIWRPGHPAQIWGLNAYQELYADARKWLREGWLDYFAPQLYWRIEPRGQSYPVLLRWWAEQNLHARHLWPGNFVDRVGHNPPKRWPAGEILDQIRLTRQDPGATGNVHFSMTTLLRSPDNLAARLASEAYATPALVPESPWLGGSAPGAPTVCLLPRDARTVLRLQPPAEDEVWLWTVQIRTGARWETRVVPGWERLLPLTGSPDQVSVAAVGRTGSRGPIASVSIPSELGRLTRAQGGACHS